MSVPFHGVPSGLPFLAFLESGRAANGVAVAMVGVSGPSPIPPKPASDGYGSGADPLMKQAITRVAPPYHATDVGATLMIARFCARRLRIGPPALLLL